MSKGRVSGFKPEVSGVTNGGFGGWARLGSITFVCVCGTGAGNSEDVTLSCFLKPGKQRIVTAMIGVAKIAILQSRRWVFIFNH